MKEISKLLSDYPLYKKLKLTLAEQKNPNAFNGLTFDFYCKTDKEIKTFALEPYPTQVRFDLRLPNFGGIRHHQSQDGNHYFTQQYKGVCRYCNTYHTDIILNVFTHQGAIYLRKVGQFPPHEITPEQFLLDYLTEEDQENYKKALMNISHSYGIGAYAYLRRVVENEIKRIITDVSNLDIPDAEKIKEAMAKYEENHQMTPLIEEIYPYLPSSLKELGDNPLKILYSQLSGGIHEFSEDECLEKASHLDVVLKFVIKKINEEKSDVGGIKEALRKLTGND